MIIWCVPVVAVVVIAAALFLTTFQGLPTNKRHVRFEIGASSRFTPSQLSDVSNQVKDRFNASGCTIHSIRYNERASDEQVESEYSMQFGESSTKSAAQKYGKENVVLIGLDFTCGKFVEQSLNPYERDTFYYCYAWHDHHWIYIDNGDS